jgi:hypothetical protein
VSKLTSLAVFSCLVAVALGHAAGAAGAVITNIREPFVLTETSPCTGERVTFRGAVHFLLRFTESTSGNVISGLHLNSVSGVATAENGVKYVLRDGSTSKSKNFLPAPISAENFTATIRLHLIRQGESLPDDDLTFRAVFHFTINPRGEVTVAFDKISDFECK